jgi:hypothetical protein
LLRDGTIGGAAFGRLLVEGGVEVQRWRLPGRILRPGFAMFFDAARPWHPLPEAGRPMLHADLGAGLRLRLAGHRGALRVDAAVGARDGRWTLSAGWHYE